MIYTDRYESPLGRILLTGDELGLTGLRFAEGEGCPPRRWAARSAITRSA